jgi:ADP-dependent phosphofructokinase/glucokinase
MIENGQLPPASRFGQNVDDINDPGVSRCFKFSRLLSVPKSGTLIQRRSRRMIVSFRDAWLRAFSVEDMRSRHIPSDLESRLCPQDPNDRRRDD